MTPRTKNRLALLGLLLALVGVAVVALTKAPLRDDAPALAQLLQALDGEQFPTALDATALRDRWDLPGLMQNLRARRMAYGEFREVLSSEPAQAVAQEPERVERQRFQVAFERRTVPVTVTLVRRGRRWLIQDFAVAMPPMLPGAEMETRARRAAREAAEHLAGPSFEPLHDMLVRARRLSEPLEPFREAVRALIGEHGPLREVVEDAWTLKAGAGELRARLRFESVERRVRVRVTFAADEGRWVVSEFARED